MPRLVIEEPCGHDLVASHWIESLSMGPWASCPGGSRTVIDLDSLPSHRIEAAAQAIADFERESWRDHDEEAPKGQAHVGDYTRRLTRAAVRAFLETDHVDNARNAD